MNKRGIITIDRGGVAVWSHSKFEFLGSDMYGKFYVDMYKQFYVIVDDGNVIDVMRCECLEKLGGGPQHLPIKGYNCYPKCKLLLIVYSDEETKLIDKVRAVLYGEEEERERPELI